MLLDEKEDLLAAVGSLREQYRAAWHESAARFNIFDALNVECKELSHSKFLSFLLNPSQRHDQGDRYLRSFLALVDITVRDDLDRAEVVTEHSISPYGQLDVLIRIPSVLTLCIENKVAAQDQDNQIKSYLNWLDSLRTGPDIRALVYLTPQARRPQDPLLGCDVRPLKLLSYSQIADWVECQSQSFPVRLRTVTEMYVQTCRKIAGVAMSPKIDGQSWLAIVAATAGVDNFRHPACYAILAGDLSSTKCYYGIRRKAAKNTTADTSDTFDEQISRELTTDLHFSSNDWFCGYRYFSDEGIFTGSPDETEWLVQLNADNHLTEMPLAAKIAEDIWGLMSRFRGPLEKLNAPWH